MGTNDSGSEVEEEVGERFVPEINGCSSLIPVLSDSSSSNDRTWQRTIENVVKSVVSIHFAQTANFDSDPAVVSEATGFVVDSKLGIIMTNRHVVGVGPFWGYAVFDNHEECDVTPIYRDPVHDFGFLKFSPSAIKYMQIEPLKLRPDLAKVGCEIRVVGNDAGEKLSILSGFISRLDRNAPEYGGLTYNDFNTEYIQAAASASGGSSGSPVVDIDGNAVALQAGGSTESSTDFFLPVYRALRALKCIQNNEKIVRGTIQVQWLLRPFDECRRLGLRPDTESQMRKSFPNIIGLLVAEVVLPEGPSDGLIKEGDTLISINGINISTFITVDEILDDSVGKPVKLLLQRGGKDLSIEIEVGDLHKITPNRYLDVCGASFNDMSYQMARIYAIPVKGVFVNNASGSFFFDNSEKFGWILDSIDDNDTPDLDTFIEVMKKIPDESRVPVVFRHITDLHCPHVSSVLIDRHWHTTFRLAVRNDSTGLWDFQDLQEKPLPPVELKPQSAKIADIPTEITGCAHLSRSFVLIHTILPVPLDAFPEERKRGYGLIIDAQHGYVVVSRYIVPHDLLDVYITVAESIIVAGKVVFLHPTQNYAVVKYDPSLIIAPLETPKFSEIPLHIGDKCTFVGYNYNLRVVTQETKITDIASLNVPVSSMQPRYRGTNLESIQIDTSLASHCHSGVLADANGTIRALWLSFLGDRNSDTDNVYKMGLDITELNSIIKSFQNAVETPNLRIIEAEFYSLPITQARIRKVPDEWISKLEENADDIDRLQFLGVSRVTVPLPGHEKVSLLPGDIVLSIDDKPVSRTKDVDVMYNKEELNFKIVRKKQVMDIKVKTVSANLLNTSQLLIWSGALLQAPHHGVRQLMKNLPSSIYVTSRAEGSPARHYGIGSTNFITHANEIPTPDLNSFLEVIKKIPDNTYCKLRLVTYDNIPFAITLKTNYHYFPTTELKKNPETGKWIEHEYK
ncbi:hypothetical protein PACTADRAFT_38751 [Pachysolen tannophilus NRRL Y-2460]|uniref:Pro-apoptotic serine protease NMA111 n=1 Tax=Pachysolen tannophilus NRRL Y-2460 TaxID=669874 RepID=A0A1E4U0A0_PACTA|nr:hypothetical protein PACTADRAFT_38751 [Pachysolen tannophilus NRRL Y-2460]